MKIISTYRKINNRDISLVTDTIGYVEKRISKTLMWYYTVNIDITDICYLCYIFDLLTHLQTALCNLCDWCVAKLLAAFQELLVIEYDRVVSRDVPGLPVNRLTEKNRLTGFLLTEPKPTRWRPSWHSANRGSSVSSMSLMWFDFRRCQFAVSAACSVLIEWRWK